MCIYGVPCLFCKLLRLKAAPIVCLLKRKRRVKALACGFFVSLQNVGVFLFIGKWHPGAFTNSVLTRWHFTHTLALLGELDHFYPGAFPDVAIIGNSFKDNDALFEINTMNIPVVALISPTMEFYGQLVTYPVFGDSAYLSARMFLYNLCAKAWIEGQLIQFTLNKCDRLKRPYYLMRSTVMFRRYLFRRASIRKNRQYLWKYIDGLSVGVTAL